MGFALTPDGANSILARLVYLMRWFSNSPGTLAEESLVQTRTEYNRIKAEVAKSIMDAERRGLLKARPALGLILDKLIMSHSSTFSLITTNWDSVVPNAVRSHLRRNYVGDIHPLHVHGIADNPDLLYLPSEVTKEKYRTHDEEQQVGGIHGSVMTALEGCQRVVLFGLSLDPLDAELCQTLYSGWNHPGLREIYIVNPDHARVAHRVNLLLDPSKKVSVFGCDADTVKTVADYSVNK